VCRSDEQGSTVTFYVPSALHDQLVQLAAQRGISVCRTVRELVLVSLPRKEPADG
jgi:hypothetical protein